MQIIFTFTINLETQEAAFAGNIEPQAALQILQQIVIMNTVQKISNERKDKEEKSSEV